MGVPFGEVFLATADKWGHLWVCKKIFNQIKKIMDWIKSMDGNLESNKEKYGLNKKYGWNFRTE